MNRDFLRIESCSSQCAETVASPVRERVVILRCISEVSYIMGGIVADSPKLENWLFPTMTMTIVLLLGCVALLQLLISFHLFPRIGSDMPRISHE